MNFQALLKELVEYSGSDLYLIAGAVPAMAVDGAMKTPKASGSRRTTPDLTLNIAREIMTEWHWREFDERRELNMAYMEPAIGRFRVNFLWQRGSIGIVIRRVVEDIPTLRSLGLPPSLREIALADRGIVIVSGATGSGKSTTMASMIDYRNHLRTGHIVTIEDPIEFVYQHRRSIVTQREIGVDTISFEEALRNSLRQAPSVISIGEMRDAETVRFALHASETGHLVFATLHSTNAVLTLERLLHFFPSDSHEQVMMQIALNLKAIVCQRLIPREAGGRACAAEVMINTPRVGDLIAKGEVTTLRELVKTDNQDSTQSFDLSIYRLCKSNVISKDNAMRAADSCNELEMKFRGLGITPNSAWNDLSDPWAIIEEDYDWPHHMMDRSWQNQITNETYTNEDAISESRGQSGITPMLTSRPTTEDENTVAMRLSPKLDKPVRKVRATTEEDMQEPASAHHHSRVSAAQKYRDLIEQATRDPKQPAKPLTDLEDLDLD